MQERWVASEAVQSPTVSPLPFSGGEPVPSLLSRPWPYSWSETPGSSPVLLQPPPALKKLSVAPFQ